MIFNWLDYIILIVVVLVGLWGFKRGFVRTIMTLLFWVLAYLVAIMFKAQLAPWFERISDNHNMQLSLAFITLFLLTILVGWGLNYILASMVDSKGLGLLNRIVGFIFGGAVGFLLSTFVIYVISLTHAKDSKAWQKSQCIAIMNHLVDGMKHVDINKIKDKAKQSLHDHNPLPMGKEGTDAL